MEKTYVAYFTKDNKFNVNNIEIDLNNWSHNGKPKAAFWGSPDDDESYGWKEWCHDNDYHVDDYNWDDPIRFKVNGKILAINRNNFPEWKGFFKRESYGISKALDFEKIVNSGYAAVELENPSMGHFSRDFESPETLAFYTWDCQSICVLDKEAIEFI